MHTVTVYETGRGHRVRFPLVYTFRQGVSPPSTHGSQPSPPRPSHSTPSSSASSTPRKTVAAQGVDRKGKGVATTANPHGEGTSGVKRH